MDQTWPHPNTRMDVYRQIVRVDDCLKGAYKTTVSRFHLHPEAEVKIVDDNCAEIIFFHHTIRFTSNGDRLMIEDTCYSPQFGISVPNKALVITFGSDQLLQQDFSW